MSRPLSQATLDAIAAAVAQALAAAPVVAAASPVAPAPVYQRALKPTCSCGHRFGKEANIAQHLAWAGVLPVNPHTRVKDS